MSNNYWTKRKDEYDMKMCTDGGSKSSEYEIESETKMEQGQRARAG